VRIKVDIYFNKQMCIFVCLFFKTNVLRLDWAGLTGRWNMAVISLRFADVLPRDINTSYVITFK